MSARFSSVGMAAAVVLATVTLAACASSPHSLEQVEASNPSTTYEYRGDEELLQAQRNAVEFCRQYDSAPRPATFTEARDGGTEVVFECDPNLPVTVTLQEAAGPDLTYSYRSDQELLDASRRAKTHCMINGSQVTISSISANADASRTVMFRCTPG